METENFFSVSRPWEEGQKNIFLLYMKYLIDHIRSKEVHLKVVFGRFNSFVRLIVTDRTNKNKQKQTNKTSRVV